MLFCNKDLAVSEKCWTASNGATRKTLCLINKTGKDIEKKFGIDCRVGFLNKGNHSFIFMNPGKPNNDRIIGLFLNTDYGYDLIEGEELFSNSSFGGPGNSESKFGIYVIGSLIAERSYKNRRGENYSRLTAKGWEKVEKSSMIEDSEITEV